MDNTKIKAAEAATLLGKSNLFVYEAMRRGFLNIGVAIQMPNSTKWTFSISPTLLAEYLGIDIPTLNERLKEIRERKVKYEKTKDSHKTSILGACSDFNAR